MLLNRREFVRDVALVTVTAFAAPAWLVLLFADGPHGPAARVIAIAVLVVSAVSGFLVYKRSIKYDRDG